MGDIIDAVSSEIVPVVTTLPADENPSREKALKMKLEALKELDHRKFNYIVARAHNVMIERALEEADLSKSWYYTMEIADRDYMESLSMDLKYETSLLAMYKLADASYAAAKVKVEGLKSTSEKIKQAAATEILDRTIGKPGSNVNVHSHVDIAFDLPWRKN
jgi:5-hydroxyisourate hydrolase-like protein (transthyretin family)